jgi:hypothetical protein
MHFILTLSVYSLFYNLVYLFPDLFWGQPFDSVAVFVNKINNLATQSWKKNSGLCSIENKKNNLT